MSFYFVVIFYPMFSWKLFSSFFWGEMEINLYVHVYIQDNRLLESKIYLKVFADRSPVPKDMEIKYKWSL